MWNVFILPGSPQQSWTVIQALPISTLVYFMHAMTDTSGFETSFEYCRTIIWLWNPFLRVHSTRSPCHYRLRMAF
jgi:hypothetical protein